MLAATDSIPLLRDDIDVFPYNDGGEEFLVFYDRQRISPEPHYCMLPAALARVELLDGVKSAQQLAQELGRAAGNGSAEAIARTFDTLERGGYLQSKNFSRMRMRMEREYYRAAVRAPFHAGHSYPGSRYKLQDYLHKLFRQVDTSAVQPGARAIVAPHIDLSIDAAAYVPAYAALAGSDADLFVIIGTSHYGLQDFFIPTERSFDTPLGTVHTDRELVRAIRSELPYTLDGNDIAHRAEHSIEFQLVFLQYLFGKRDFTILPILATSFQPFVEAGTAPATALRFRQYVKALRKVIKESRRKVAFIASADLAHIGRKFGDDFDAAQELAKVREEDAALIAAIEKADAESFFQCVAASGDARRICGLPPVYTLLETCRPQSGSLLHYGQWHEENTGSAVSYAALALY